MKELRKYAWEVIDKHPNLKEDIAELIALCMMEIEDGESQEHEIESCYLAINDLL